MDRAVPLEDEEESAVEEFSLAANSEEVVLKHSITFIQLALRLFEVAVQEQRVQKARRWVAPDV